MAHSVVSIRQKPQTLAAKNFGSTCVNSRTLPFSFNLNRDIISGRIEIHGNALLISFFFPPPLSLSRPPPRLYPFFFFLRAPSPEAMEVVCSDKGFFCVHCPCPDRCKRDLTEPKIGLPVPLCVSEDHPRGATRNVFHILTEKKPWRLWHPDVSSRLYLSLSPSPSSRSLPVLHFVEGNNDNFVMRTNLPNCEIVRGAGS